MQALLSFNQKLQVLTAPTDLMPLDIVGPKDISKMIETARTNFDYVIIDMPKTMTEWSETVLSAAHVYFAMLELDMRSAQNALRLKRALQSEDLPFEKLRFILNRAPEIHRSQRQVAGQAPGRKPWHLDRGAAARWRQAGVAECRPRHPHGRRHRQEPAAQGNREAGEIGPRGQ